MVDPSEHDKIED
jgi:hypothetical protein